VDARAIPALEWLMNMTYWKCEINKYEGLFVDQKYLDILALEFNDIVTICRHPGCNLATWNSISLKRKYSESLGCWLINDLYKPIFFHFSSIGIDLGKRDPMLSHYYNRYSEEVMYLSKMLLSNRNMEFQEKAV
jgi:hypothetical protein